jgi:hypothetical protein
MDLNVFAAPGLAGEAKRFLAAFQVNSIVSPTVAVEHEPEHGDQCLLYLSGQEDGKLLTKPLKALARWKRRVHTIVLYARRPDHRKIVDWARAAERVLPDRTQFCFSAAEVARAFKLRARTLSTTGASGPQWAGRYRSNANHDRLDPGSARLGHRRVGAKRTELEGGPCFSTGGEASP